MVLFFRVRAQTTRPGRFSGGRASRIDNPIKTPPARAVRSVGVKTVFLGFQVIDMVMLPHHNELLRCEKLYCTSYQLLGDDSVFFF